MNEKLDESGGCLPHALHHESSQFLASGGEFILLT